MVKLSVNVDHIATIREARKSHEPDPVAAAILAELAGALGITFHLREDRRHIQDRDVEILRKVCTTRLDMEMAATEDMIKIAIKHRPDIVTLVPERIEEITTEGGLNVVKNEKSIGRVIQKLHAEKLVVSIFVDPEIDQVRAAARDRADFIEINTGKYAETKKEKERARELFSIEKAAMEGQKLGLRIAAGHGLNYVNVKPVARVKGVEELNIGHSIIARASLVGMERAVREMLSLIT
ncbi:MAG: pyridoxine 5'-phosphate synthase [Acidobacteriota bacterium]